MKYIHRASEISRMAEEDTILIDFGRKLKPCRGRNERVVRRNELADLMQVSL